MNALYTTCSCSLASCPDGETTEESQRFSDPKLRACIGRRRELACFAVVINAYDAIVFEELLRDLISRADNRSWPDASRSMYVYLLRTISLLVSNMKHSLAARVSFPHRKIFIDLLARDITRYTVVYFLYLYVQFLKLIIIYFVNARVILFSVCKKLPRLEIYTISFTRFFVDLITSYGEISNLFIFNIVLMSLTRRYDLEEFTFVKLHVPLFWSRFLESHDHTYMLIRLILNV